MLSSTTSRDRDGIALLVIALFSLLPVAVALVRGEILTFRDHFDYFLPLREFTAEALRAGEIPFWNPYNGSGERWLANPQTGIFYPPSWLFIALPISAASNLFLALHLAILGAGSFNLFRRGASREASLLCAVALMLSGPTLSLLDVSNNLASFSWLPFIILAALERPRIDRDALLIGLMFLGGEPLFAACGALIYSSIVLSGAREEPDGLAPPILRKRLQRVTLVAVITILLVLPQLLPFLGMLHGSDRAAGLASELALRNSMSPREWLTMLVPVTSERVRSQSFVTLTFVPLLVLGAAAVALAGRWDRDRKIFALLAFVSGVVATLPSIAAVGDLLAAGGLTFARYPARFVPFAIFGLCGLAAAGSDTLRERLELRGRATVVLLILGLAALSFAARTPMAITLSVANAAAAFLFLFVSRTAAYRIALTAVPLIALGAAAPVTQSSPVEMLRTPYASTLSRETKIARVLSSDHSREWSRQRRLNLMTGYRNLTERKFDVSTPAPVVDRGYLTLHDAAMTPRLDLLSMMGVGYVLSEQPLHVADFVQLREEGSPYLYQTRRALAMAHVSTPRATPEQRTATRIAWRFVSLTRVAIDVTTATGGLVVLNQTDAPGWSVTIDGKGSKKERAQIVFRAVVVPPGRHRVVWEYREPGFAIALLISLITLSLLIAHARRRGAGASGPRVTASSPDYS